MKGRRANPVKIGAFVVGGVVILVAAVLLIGSGRIFRRTVSFVSYFDGSVNGLRAGASVKYKGVELGKVTRIRIPYWLERTDPPIAVFYALDGDKLDDVGEGSEPTEKALVNAIHQGLRAQLETDSFVTGILHLSLALLPASEANLHEPIEGVLEIPTVPPPQQQIGAAVRSLVDRLAQYDFEELFDSLKSALDGVSDLSRAPELRSVLTSLDQALRDLDAWIVQLEPLGSRLLSLAENADALAVDLRAEVGSAHLTLEAVQTLSRDLSADFRLLAASLIQTSQRLQAASLAVESTLESTRGLLDPQAPLAVELRAGLRELSDTARSARMLRAYPVRAPGAQPRCAAVRQGRAGARHAMNATPRTIAATVAVVLAGFGAAACSLFSPASTPIHYAVLVPVQELPGADPAPPPSSAVRVGLGPVALPEYLLRPSLVSREHGTRLVASETERWAEPLDRSVERVLALDLQHAMGVARLIPHPWYASERPDLQIEIAFSRFEREESGRVVVQAAWSLRPLARDPAQGEPARIERMSKIEHEAGADGPGTALALSRALADLSREIADVWALETRALDSSDASASSLQPR
jgi:paraquat-inducible protein B